MPRRSHLAEALSTRNPDHEALAACAFRVDVEATDAEQPVHFHRKGQLIVALRGAVTCMVRRAMWMVPPHHAVWIPGGMPHSNRATDNAQIYFLFVEPGAAELPERCCTLTISPMVREMIRHLADSEPRMTTASTSRLVMVLLEQLAASPVGQLHLPVSGHPKLQHILDALTADPSDRTTLGEWAARLALSERSLARLVIRETGLSFGRWRQQHRLIVGVRQLSAGAAVQQVAGDLGYESVTAFIAMFKKALGKPPGQYFADLKATAA